MSTLQPCPRAGAGVVGTQPGTTGLPPLAHLPPLGRLPAQQLRSVCFPEAPELPLLKAAPTRLAMKRSSQGCLQ